jgi:2,4-dienoyl-CoA reductase-like NADH-dependent reductase (Old Yellow Enzyme family)
MSVEDINAIVDAFISAVERCKTIGCEFNQL